MWRSSFGLVVGGGSVKANSVVVVLPRTMAPAARSRTTTVASGPANSSVGNVEPARVGRPATLTMSLTPTRNGRSVGSCRSASASRRRLLGSATRAHSRGSTRSTRSHASWISCFASMSPDVTSVPPDGAHQSGCSLENPCIAVQARSSGRHRKKLLAYLDLPDHSNPACIAVKLAVVGECTGLIERE